MKIKHWIFLSLGAGLVGICFFLIQGQFILIKLPGFSYPALEKSKPAKPAENQRNFSCFIWKNRAMTPLQKKVLCPQDPAETIKRIVNVWLVTLVEEGVINEEIKLHNVALTQQGTVALLVFDRNFIPSHFSTPDRWQLIESLLATLRVSGVVLEGIYFLENNQLFQDPYLDFSHRWPIGGYRAQ